MSVTNVDMKNPCLHIISCSSQPPCASQARRSSCAMKRSASMRCITPRLVSGTSNRPSPGPCARAPAASHSLHLASGFPVCPSKTSSSGRWRVSRSRTNTLSAVVSRAPGCLYPVQRTLACVAVRATVTQCS
eukprot:3940379-Rhodomonas_salina.2